MLDDDEGAKLAVLARRLGLLVRFSNMLIASAGFNTWLSCTRTR